MVAVQALAAVWFLCYSRSFCSISVNTGSPSNTTFSQSFFLVPVMIDEEAVMYAQNLCELRLVGTFLFDEGI